MDSESAIPHLNDISKLRRRWSEWHEHYGFAAAFAVLFAFVFAFQYWMVKHTSHKLEIVQPVSIAHKAAADDAEQFPALDVKTGTWSFEKRLLIAEVVIDLHLEPDGRFEFAAAFNQIGIPVLSLSKSVRGNYTIKGQVIEFSVMDGARGMLPGDGRWPIVSASPTKLVLAGDDDSMTLTHAAPGP